MNKPWRVDVLQCRGSSYDVGKQMAEGFLKIDRGSTFHRRKGHQPFGFIHSERRAGGSLHLRAEYLGRTARTGRWPHDFTGAGRCPILEQPLELSEAWMLVSYDQSALRAQLRLQPASI
jgi:hypothetical protein